MIAASVAGCASIDVPFGHEAATGTVLKFAKTHTFLTTAKSTVLAAWVMAGGFWKSNQGRDWPGAAFPV